MLYALLAYGRPATPRQGAGPIDGVTAAVLARPYVTGCARIAQELQDARTGGAIEVRPIFEGLFRGA